MKFSELRQDLVSEDWIVIAPKRAGRPHASEAQKPRARVPMSDCFFEDPEKGSGKTALMKYGGLDDTWTIQIIENKFPAFRHKDTCSVVMPHGPYSAAEGIGHHDLVITRDHDTDFPDLSREMAVQVFQAFRDRYLMLLNDTCLAYVSFFHNWGSSAGASIYHPHYQIIAIPVVPPDIQHSLDGALRYARKHATCVHCTILSWELKEKKRIIYENKGAIAFVPFAARVPFEIRIFPKAHLPYIENSYDHHLEYVVEALQESLKMMRKTLGDPDYNFFIHSAPILNKKKYKSYHWHIEVLPKVNIAAGFELGTGLDINPVDPDDAARALRAGRRK